jgi:hypothetical protein
LIFRSGEFVLVKFFLVPLCLVGFACASSSSPPETSGHVASASTETQAAPATAETTGGEEVASNTDDDRPVCKMEETIGSHMKKRICRSREQIEREKREAQKMSRRAAVRQGGSAQ